MKEQNVAPLRKKGLSKFAFYRVTSATALLRRSGRRTASPDVVHMAAGGRRPSIDTLRVCALNAKATRPLETPPHV